MFSLHELGSPHHLAEIFFFSFGWGHSLLRLTLFLWSDSSFSPPLRLHHIFSVYYWRSAIATFVALQSLLFDTTAIFPNTPGVSSTNLDNRLYLQLADPRRLHTLTRHLTLPTDLYRYPIPPTTRNHVRRPQSYHRPLRPRRRRLRR